MNKPPLNTPTYYKIPAVKEILDMITVCTDPNKNPPEIDKDYDAAVFHGKTIQIHISNYSTLPNNHIPTFAYILLIIFLIDCETQNRATPIFEINLKRILEIRHTQSKSSVTNRLTASLSFLNNLSLSNEDVFFPLFDCPIEYNSGIIKGTFSSDFFIRIKLSRAIYLHEETLSLNTKLSPNGFYLGMFFDNLLNQKYQRRSKIRLERILLASPFSSFIDFRTKESLSFTKKTINKILDDANTLDHLELSESRCNSFSIYDKCNELLSTKLPSGPKAKTCEKVTSALLGYRMKLTGDTFPNATTPVSLNFK